jgi:hypothetical protein
MHDVGKFTRWCWRQPKAMQPLGRGHRDRLGQFDALHSGQFLNTLLAEEPVAGTGDGSRHFPKGCVFERSRQIIHMAELPRR